MPRAGLLRVDFGTWERAEPVGRLDMKPRFVFAGEYFSPGRAGALGCRAESERDAGAGNAHGQAHVCDAAQPLRPQERLME